MSVKDELTQLQFKHVTKALEALVEGGRKINVMLTKHQKDIADLKERVAKLEETK